MIELLLTVSLLVLAFIAGHIFGYTHGRASGKVVALERTQDIDLSGRGGDD